MSGEDWLATRFEANRSHLRSVAYRMLGSEPEAEDAVQEAWIRLSRSDTATIDNLGGWLTTVVGRICLDMLRARRVRPERPVQEHSPTIADDVTPDPELEAVQADSVGLALLVVLETLTPAERLAFVLHDLFAVPFDEVAPIIGKTPAAARQIASRARRRVRGTPEPAGADVLRQKEVVNAFLAAARDADFTALLEVLDPDIVLHADAGAAAYGTEAPLSGAADVARMFLGRAAAARLVLVDGIPGLVWMRRGEPVIVFSFTVTEGRVEMLELRGDPEYLENVELVPLKG
ncbi:RNA polymerase sigma factor SigJ [Kribbella hippodromi]|uniref:RNA polymerase sigma factor SigJ n=1 Tax=Kribbella hippodromi TaxID=434347 RepID=A0ABN2EJM7_9ACTN